MNIDRFNPTHDFTIDIRFISPKPRRGPIRSLDQRKPQPASPNSGARKNARCPPELSFPSPHVPNFQLGLAWHREYNALPIRAENATGYTCLSRLNKTYLIKGGKAVNRHGIRKSRRTGLGREREDHGIKVHIWGWGGS